VRFSQPSPLPQYLGTGDRLDLRAEVLTWVTLHPLEYCGHAHWACWWWAVGSGAGGSLCFEVVGQFFFFLLVVGFELRASHLLGRCSTT
jgi:hypothetical protein